MQCYVVFPSAHTMHLTEVEMPEPNPQQFTLRARITGVSAGTEAMWFAGTATAIRSGRKAYPYRPGYEFVGDVTAVGPEVGGVAVGDRIFTLKPHGTYALVGPSDAWFKLPPSIADEDALAIPLCATAIHAVHRACMAYGDSAAIVGLGALGIITLQVLASDAARDIVAVTRSPSKAEWARSCGARMVLVDDLDTATVSKLDVSIAFECSGTNSGLVRASSLLANQGKLVCAGFYKEPLMLSGEELFAKELTILGIRARGPTTSASEFLRWNAFANMKLALELVHRGAVRLGPYVTHRITPQALEEIYSMIIANKEPFGQIIIDWSS